jgi:hypothetical protein|nr:MAG TPA: hypothetical protein [Bacteriophage sp.]
METTIMVNLKERSFTISGSEEFVERNKQELKDFIMMNIEQEETIIANKSEQEEKKEYITEEQNRYIRNGIYAIDSEDGTVTILKKIPGKTNAEKTKNIALIVLFAKGENEKIQGSEIRRLCEKQKCYDAKNFAATFKRDMSNFIMKGKGQSWTIELSIPGKDNAKELLESLCNNE